MRKPVLIIEPAQRPYKLDNTISGIISGTGALTKSGAGALTLTSDNTFTGATTISAGTLQIGNGGATGSLAGLSIVDNSALIFNRSNALTYAGVVSGTGTLTQLGAGTTTLTGANTYTGGTTISAGTLQLGNGGVTGSIVGDVLDNSVLAFNRSAGRNRHHPCGVRRRITPRARRGVPLLAAKEK